MAEPDEIDEAVIAKLKASSDLMTLFAYTDAQGNVSGVVYFDVAPPGIPKFVLVSLVIGQDEDVFGETDAADQDNLYLVKAVAQASDEAVVKEGARLIHSALQKQALTISGYSHMVTKRVERVRYTEVDDDTDIRWQHRGGRYQVMASSNG